MDLTLYIIYFQHTINIYVQRIINTYLKSKSHQHKNQIDSMSYLNLTTCIPFKLQPVNQFDSSSIAQ